jgi:hypothetical protein
VKRSSVIIMLHHSRNTASKQWKRHLRCAWVVWSCAACAASNCPKTPEFEAHWNNVLSLLETQLQARLVKWA